MVFMLPKILDCEGRKKRRITCEGTMDFQKDGKIEKEKYYYYLAPLEKKEKKSNSGNIKHGGTESILSRRWNTKMCLRHSLTVYEKREMPKLTRAHFSVLILATGDRAQQEEVKA